MMKPCLLIVIMMCILLKAYPGSAYYIIRMKNGRTLPTHQYWENGTRVMFYIYNGVMGIEKSFVSKIEDAEDSEIRGHYIDNSHRMTVQRNTVNSEKTSESTVPNLSVNAPHETFTEAHDKILQDLSKIESEFQSIHLMSTEQIYQFSEKLTEFKKYIFDKGLAHVYADQLDQAFKIGDEMEDILKSRTP